MTETTWQELKDKRDNGELIPGSLYRITDYNCTTTQENTRSAGHQFDIVLLALSENKLAEEGWAMEHPTDVYDVTFEDGVIKRGYLYFFDDDANCNFVLVDTLQGYELGFGSEDFKSLDVINKTASIEQFWRDAETLLENGVQYSYFQNSNLSAWKVWYCLDNDTDRFAWADDSVDEGSPASINIYDENRDENFECIRDASLDENEYYAWKDSNSNKVFYTTEDSPSTNSDVYAKITNVIEKRGSCSITSFTPAHEGTGLPNGRGVIYRLIDEWDNDCPYDFKNIQFIRKLTDGHINAQGSDTWCYTFNAYFNGDIYDYSIVSAIWKDDEDDVQPVMNNTIYSVKSDNGGSKKLNDFVFNADGAEPDVYSVVIKNNLFLNIRDGGNFEGTTLMHSIFLDIRNNIIYNDNANGIIYQNEKVVFENIT